jgi:hypothetical protein
MASLAGIGGHHLAADHASYAIPYLGACLAARGTDGKAGRPAVGTPRVGHGIGYIRMPN